MAIITLLTDFGLADTYVGQVKGAILAVAPGTSLVDLTHAVEPQDVLGGAWQLALAVDVFPVGTIHLAVVDPGVGSTRRAIAVRARRGDVFVGPDNGLLMPGVERLGGLTSAVELTAQRYWRGEPTATFHGRDIFGPVAGHLAAGVALEALGTPIGDPVPLALPEPKGDVGEVIHVDTYGNLITNLRLGDVPVDEFLLRVNHELVASAPFYDVVPAGELLALEGSAGLLEIALRDGSAARLTGARRGTPVFFERL
ncbi:MAG TPA: SAM-dependent chlorinase/fluorinase [Chloroflexota bacterium]|jgi:hypothetical protein|nr:SAM-dependent chlorinase/fluorinase [Chloroflexota bacterium]